MLGDQRSVLTSGTHRSFFGREFLQVCLVPFFDCFGVVGGKIGVVVGANPGKVAESFQLGAALQVALIGRQDKAEPGPTRVTLLVYRLYRIQKADELP